MQRGTIQTLMQLQLKGLLMRTIILYASRHHGNTKKLVDAIVEAHPEIDTLDVKSLGKNEYPDLHEYHLIGVATGIYYSEIDTCAHERAAAAGQGIWPYDLWWQKQVVRQGYRWHLPHEAGHLYGCLRLPRL